VRQSLPLLISYRCCGALRVETSSSLPLHTPLVVRPVIGMRPTDRQMKDVDGFLRLVSAGAQAKHAGARFSTLI
jgi:hypothetical protein